MWESLSQSHAFIDGNKRTAFAAVYTFLAINEVELNVPPTEAYDFIAHLHETGTFRFSELAK